ncbi:MAG: ribonuclease III [Oscillospiraceae bacterium]|nr:ribonuclease III [Oscillospiraceae bacterium]
MSEFERVIGYNFKNRALLKQALTHSSVGSSFCNERMEFLGDSVLSIVVARYLYDNLPHQPEGDLTKLRSNLVCEDALYNYAKKIGLGERLALSKGEENTGGRDRKSILSDAFEALIAAIYLDSGADGIERAKAFIVPFLPDNRKLKSGKLAVVGDYKTILQELVQKNADSTINYELVNEVGAAHQKVFFTNVVINGKVEGAGSGHSKKEASQQAARAALLKRGYEV